MRIAVFGSLTLEDIVLVEGLDLLQADQFQSLERLRKLNLSSFEYILSFLSTFMFKHKTLSN